MNESNMNLLRGKLPKTLALLAVILLPLQQSLAATCCCRQSRGTIRGQTNGSVSNCCSQGQAGCCAGESDAGSSCCRDGESSTGMTPCRCLAGCCGLDDPRSLDTAPAELPSADELANAVNRTAVVVAIHAMATQTLPDSSLSDSMGGPRLSVLLCRYRL